MKWPDTSPAPLVVTGHGVFQRGIHLKICVLEQELDIQLQDVNLIDALAGRLEARTWEEIGQLLGKLFLELIGPPSLDQRDLEPRKVFLERGFLAVQQALLDEMGYQ